MSGRTRDIPKNSAAHPKLLTKISDRIKFAMKGRKDHVKQWTDAENQALAYIPETEVDSLRRADRENRGNPRYTTIVVPYSYALIMATHTYLTSVFFARSPVHQFAGRHGETEQQVSALEALISYQVDAGEFLVPYYIWLYDVAKYGFGILGNYWCSELVQVSSLAEQLDPNTGKSQKIEQCIQIPGYTGNKVYNVSPFDFLHDPRFPIYRFQEGEFCGRRIVLGWNEIVKRKNQGYYMNLDDVPKKSGGGTTSSFEQGSSALVRPEDANSIAVPTYSDHPEAVECIEFFVELIQKEWELGPQEYPEKWVFTVTSDLSVIIGAQPLGSFHGKFPFDIGNFEPEGYGLYPRGVTKISAPIQQTVDWLLNTHFFNVRAALNNQFIIDPSKIVVKDAEDGGPGFIYRLRPEAYGSDINTFFKQVPVVDVTQRHVPDMEMMFGIGERVTGINDQIFGAFSGGRKTATEVRTTTGFGVNRLKTIAEFISAMAMGPHAMKLTQNSQQWYDTSMKFKIAGSLVQDAGQGFVDVSPETIAGAYSFVPVDGALPIDRMAMATLWQNLMVQMRQVPGLIEQFDISRIFTYVAQLAGIRNIAQFKISVQSPQSIIQQESAGNIVPLRPGSGPSSPASSPSANTGVRPTSADVGKYLSGPAA